MKKTIAILLLLCFLLSCSTGVGIRRSEVRYFDTGFSATVVNTAFKVKGRRYGNQTLLHLFEIHASADSVHISFNSRGELLLAYTDSGVQKEKVFSGKFTQKGYYEIYFRNQKKEIPPLVPIIYSNNDINRLRLAQTLQGELIIDNFWDRSGNIFILGAGSTGRRQSYFKVQGAE